jgi:hypothetical protein
MSAYDCTLAIGLGQTTLNNAISALYNKDGAKAAIFSGTAKIMTGMFVLWELNTAPTITFSPQIDDWSGYTDGDGKPFTYAGSGMTIAASASVNISIKVGEVVTPIGIPISMAFFGELSGVNTVRGGAIIVKFFNASLAV